MSAAATSSLPAASKCSLIIIFVSRSFMTSSSVPGVFQGQQLGIACLARLVADDDVVVAVRVEGRVEGDQVHGGSGQVATQDVEVVAVVEDVGVHRSARGVGSVGRPSLRRG